LQTAVGVELRTDAAVSELILENGAIKGVVTSKDGQPWRVGARLGVLINAGGFARNQKMRDQYQPGTSAAWTIAGPGTPAR
jgi:3-oxosteroid 1-dehydrogenase